MPVAFWITVTECTGVPVSWERLQADLQADLPQVSWAGDWDGGSSGDAQPLVSWAWPRTSARQAVTCGWLPRQANVSCFQIHTAELLLPAALTTLLIYIEGGCNSTHRRGWPWKLQDGYLWWYYYGNSLCIYYIGLPAALMSWNKAYAGINIERS